MFPIGRNLKRCLVVLWLGLVAWGATPAGLAVPPVNDTCVGAEVIPGDGPFPYLTSLLPDLSLATTEGDPLVSCVPDEASNGVWYAFTPAETGQYIFSTSGDTETTVDDTVLGVYTDLFGGCSGTYVEIACNDDEADLRAGLAVTLDAGVAYYVVGWVGYLGFNQGQTALQLRVTKPVRPDNDECRRAEEVPSAGPFPYRTELVDTYFASAEFDPVPSCISSAYRGVWYEFTPSQSGYYSLSTCGEENQTTLFDGLMVLYTSPAGCEGPFTEVACDDDRCGNQPEIRAALMAGTRYFILIWDVYFMDPIIGETGVQLEVKQFDPPTATTLEAANISSGGALLRGLIDPNGLQSVAFFEWGATPAYGNGLMVPNLLAGEDPLMVEASVGGFAPGSPVHYRVWATNLLGRVEGQDSTFQWRGVQPVITDFRKLPDGDYKVEFDAISGQLYLIQGASERLDWTIIGNATDQGDGSFSFVNRPILSGARYYRVLAP